METRGRWWNGRFGRMARRDVWLKSDGTVWRVEARDGDGDSLVWGRNYPDETAARVMVAALLARGSAEWRDLSPS